MAAAGGRMARPVQLMMERPNWAATPQAAAYVLDSRLLQKQASREEALCQLAVQCPVAAVRAVREAPRRDDRSGVW